MEWTETQIPLKVSMPLDKNARMRTPEEIQEAIKRTGDPITAIMGDHMTIPQTARAWRLEPDPDYSPAILQGMGSILYEQPIVGGYRLTFVVQLPSGPCGIDATIQADGPDEAIEAASGHVMSFLQALKADVDGLIESLED